MDYRHLIMAVVLLVVGYVIAKKTTFNLPIIG